MCLRTMNSRGWGISIALHRGCRALSGLPGLLKTKIQIRIMPQSATALIKYALKAAKDILRCSILVINKHYKLIQKEGPSSVHYIYALFQRSTPKKCI